MDTFETEKENPIIARQKNKRSKRGYMLFGFFSVVCVVILILLVRIILNIKVIRTKSEENAKEQKVLDELVSQYESTKSQTKSLEGELFNQQKKFQELNEKVNQIKKEIEDLTEQNNKLVSLS